MLKSWFASLKAHRLSSPVMPCPSISHQRIAAPLSRSISVAAKTDSQPTTLAGTIVSHNSYVLLHTRIPPTHYPAKVPSRLQRMLQLHASQWGGLVNFCWSPDQDVHPLTQDAEWESQEETYRLTAFSCYHGRLDIPEVSFRQLEEVQELLRAHGSPSRHQSNLLAQRPGESGQDIIHMYVCTHRNRDCRCGDSGGPVFEALRSEVARQELSHRVKIGAVGHVGGHKYAANVLVFPSGDWLGNLRASNVPQVLEAVLSHHDDDSDYLHAPPVLPQHWRGRMGLSKDQQLALLDCSPSRPTIQPLPR